MDFVQTEAESNGKQLLVTQGRNSAENELLAIQRLFSLRCDGVILHVRCLSDDRLRQLAAEQRSFVLLDRLVPGLEDRCVTFDHVYASQLATQQLIDVGHRRIACISGPAQRASSQQRLQGFLNAMQAANLQPLGCPEGCMTWKAATSALTSFCAPKRCLRRSTAATKKWRWVPCWRLMNDICAYRRISH